ncbi:hypothetical protein [Myroides odoratimimus]|uniref:hypothetical protein n=1 Tax=Myroides odoratimimus TaxID=76832 RepID=UPI0025751817|nr:hypothetical protein [Myroides odoratimimus]MDM1536382.1 DUF2528 family protein [Myroides odoratimimus]MDM1676046.1 DUF2528 family protein [Myroides odoratimimus]
MIKKYKVMYGFHDWECTIEINEELFTPQLLQSALDFFCWDYNKKGNLYEEYAKKLAKQIAYFSMDWNESGIIDQFEDLEGYPPLDGSMGVKLIRCDNFRLEDEEFSLGVELA